MNEAVFDGRRYLRVELVATWYEVEVAWIEEACSWGVLARALRRERELWIAGDELDRLAQAVALHRHHAMELAAIAAWLGQPAP